MIPKSERLSNALKSKTDELAGQVLNFDEERTKRKARDVAVCLKPALEYDVPRIVVTGAAGSGKTTFAGILSDTVEVPVFDLDKYIKGGFTPDKDEYANRLNAAIYALWSDLPRSDTGYIIEHVEACSRTMVRMLNPNFAILLDPGQQSLLRTAQVRNQVGSYNKDREKRALDSMKTARKSFDALPGTIVMRGGGVTVKRL